MARTLCGLRLYYENHKQLPESLAQLVPEYLPAVPIDPYDGKKLRYSKAEKQLWSVGEDLRDEGGLEDLGAKVISRKMKNEPTLFIRFAK